MLKKRKKNEKVIIYAFASIFVVVIIAFMFSFFKKAPEVVEKISLNSQQSTWETKEVKKEISEQKFYANTTISGTGTIKEIPYNMQISTSYELIYSWKTFFAKSDNYLLGNYVDKQINFSGTIVGFSSDNIPVIQITSIETNEDKEQQPEEKSDKIFTMKQLVVNLEPFEENFKITTWDNSLVIYKEVLLPWNKTKRIDYLRITFSPCKRWDPNLDCVALKNQFERLKFNKLVNNNGVVFYKFPEINYYKAFWEEYSYNFTPITWDFYALANAFSVINAKELKLETIKSTCKNKNIQLTNILDIKNKWNNYTVVWFDQNSNKIVCKLTLSNNNWLYTANLKFLDYLREEESKVSTWLNEDDYLIYSSRAYWFKVYMPKWIKYKSDLTNEDFWISGLKCLQVVNIAHRKKGNLSNPDVKVYYCKSNISKYLIEDGLSVKYEKFKVITNAGKVFIMLYSDNETAKKILNYLKVF